MLYARVSSHDQRAGLDRQVVRLTGWAAAHGMVVAGVVCEVGPGLNAMRAVIAAKNAGAGETG